MSNKSKLFEATVVDVLANGDAIIELTQELCDEMGWTVGDNLDITMENGEVVIRKIESEKMTTKVFDDVERFMNAVGHYTDKPDPSLSELYLDLIDEEYTEFKEALDEKNDADTLDACFDMIWVIVGYMKSRGWDCDAAWTEGAGSNLAKIDPETGKVIRREDGKILKPEGWKRPDFGQFV